MFVLAFEQQQSPSLIPQSLAVSALQRDFNAHPIRIDFDSDQTGFKPHRTTCECPHKNEIRLVAGGEHVMWRKQQLAESHVN